LPTLLLSDLEAGYTETHASPLSCSKTLPPKARHLYLLPALPGKVKPWLISTVAEPHRNHLAILKGTPVTTRSPTSPISLPYVRMDMDVALNSPVNVQHSPALTFSPHATSFTLLSPTLSQSDTSNLSPSAENMASSESSSPNTASESSIMPQPTSASSTPPPPSPPQHSAAAETSEPELVNVRNELVEALEQLSRVRAQLREVQEQTAQVRAQQIQIQDSLNSASEPRPTQADPGLEAQVHSTEPESASPTPQDTPSIGASISHEQPVTTVEITPTPATSAEGTAPEVTPPQPLGEESSEEQQQTEEQVQSIDAPVALEEIPQPSAPADTTPEPPEWVDIEEDTSVPDAEELKEIEAGNDISARDVKFHEESFYAEAPEDPEQQPSQKMRLTWVIKGVRGTKEKPNRGRIMNSPAVLVGGFYWFLKFFPRGNNSSALSAYVKCSRKEPKPDEEVPENTFSVVYGAPDSDLGELKPAIDMSIPASSNPLKEELKVKEDDSSADEASKKNNEGETLHQVEPANASADADKGSAAAAAAAEDQEEDAEDWRVSAQIGIIIYNPEEPRTKFDMAACHQFNKHNDDWGWTNFHGPWSEIHKRRHGQRQALLCDDTLALDAYIRVFNDPSQSLWWHSCGAEEQWDSVSLTSYPAMGTKLYHSPGVAGITSWLLLAPFRQILQSLETDAYRRDSHVRPQSLCSQLQMILYLMRKQKKDEKYVSLEAIIEIMDKLDESGTDVITFLEGFRRSLELELHTNPSAVDQIADIFDSKPDSKEDSVPQLPLRIPVENVPSIQSGIERIFEGDPATKCFPKFLTVELERQKFDTTVREWKLSYDRVRLSEELDLAKWSAKPETSKYTIYGFVVHADERNSGKFYSILRPGGPGSKWLAFEDGSANQVISYTNHRIQDFEGLEGDVLKENKTTRQTAYLAMYIRTDLLKDFLPGTLEPYDLSPWLKNCPQVSDYLESKDVQPHEEETRSEVKLEIYDSQRVKNRHGLVDTQDLKDVRAYDSNTSPRHLTVPAETTYQELRHKLAKWSGVENAEKVKLWTIQPPAPGAPLNFSFKRVSKLYKTVWDSHCATQFQCIWMHVLRTEDEVKSFGDAEPPVDPDAFDRTVIEDRVSDPDVGDVSASVPELAAQPETTSNEVVEVIEESRPDAIPQDSAVGDVALAENAELSTSDTTEVLPTASEPIIAPMTAEPVVADTLESTNDVTIQAVDVVLAAGADENLITAQAATEEDNEAQLQSPPPAVSSLPGDRAPSPPSIEAPEPASVSAEDESLIAALIAQDVENLDAAVEEESQADLVEPTVAANAESIPTNAPTTDVAVESSEVPATELPVSDQPAVDSTESAPPPPAPPAAETSNDDAQSDSSDDEGFAEEVTPARRVPFHYGFIQLFDAQAQDFLVHGDFIAQAADKVKDFIRKQLGYAEDKNFLVWCRGNAYRLTSIHADSTFEDIKDDSGNRPDGFVLVVGDVLSDST
jgi:Ubiquitin carboxyl-terminal hydrolase